MHQDDWISQLYTSAVLTLSYFTFMQSFMESFTTLKMLYKYKSHTAAAVFVALLTVLELEPTCTCHVQEVHTTYLHTAILLVFHIVVWSNSNR